MDKTIYKVIFHNRGSIYEIYAKNVDESEIFGCIAIEDIIFGEKSSVVIDPSEEHLKSEFKGVSRTYIPMHSIIRIDQVSKRGVAKITEASGNEANVMSFPSHAKNSNTEHNN